MEDKSLNVSLSPLRYADADVDYLWRMSVETYHQLIASGAFNPDDDIELIHGYLVKKMPKNRRHALITQALLAIISQIIGIGKGWFLSVQDPITLSDSEPEPDLSVVRGSYSDYSNHPRAKDIGVVIEVSDSSLDYDSLVKKEMYALDGVDQYWIVNIQDEQIEVFTEPFESDKKAGYRQHVIYLKEDTLPLVLDGKRVGLLDLKDVFPSE
ncbi:MAG: Uma2 family endonuclease [Chloroflexota bacterium]